jgi:hypothetical protein
MGKSLRAAKNRIAALSARPLQYAFCFASPSPLRKEAESLEKLRPGLRDQVDIARQLEFHFSPGRGGRFLRLTGGPVSEGLPYFSPFSRLMPSMSGCHPYTSETMNLSI